MAKKHKEFDYFDAFEQQVKFACKEAELLRKVVENFKSAEDIKETMDRAHEIEHEADLVSHDIHKSVAHDFITPFDREDIIHLAKTLDDITDSIEAVIQRMYMYDVRFMHDGTLDFARAIEKSCTALHRAMGDFRNFKRSKEFKHLIVEVCDAEEEADGLYVSVIHGLHTEDRDNPLRVFVWTNVFNRMESCADACEAAADVMNSIMIRNV